MLMIFEKDKGKREKEKIKTLLIYRPLGKLT